jgi:hypothetical protein
MDISGTLHLYSGEDRELFFTFDDDVAKDLYAAPHFDLDDKESRRAFISIGSDRFISRRTLSFSRKQSEIKVSLCKETTKDNLGALTLLYDWFAPSGKVRPKVVSVVGELQRVRHNKGFVWELALEEPVGLVSPPGLKRRLKTPSKSRKAYLHRREIHERELRIVGRLAELRALNVLEARFPRPGFSCLWRDGYLDSEKEEIREQGIICDIDVWNNDMDTVGAFIEVKAQQVRFNKTKPLFYLTSSEWRSLQYANRRRMSYRIWLVQYEDRKHLQGMRGAVRILECNRIEAKWISPEVLIVLPDSRALKTIHAI